MTPVPSSADLAPPIIIPVRLQPVTALRRVHPGWWMVAVAVALVLGWGAVNWAGGTHTALPHIMYVPIVVAALMGGLRSGAVAGIVAGLLLGPLTPLDTATGEPQTTAGWLTRMAFFVVIGILVGEGRRRLLRMEMTRQKFISAVAHEVRTPLSAILGFSQIIEERHDELPESELREFAQVITREVAELQDIIEGYIVAAQLDDSALVFEPRPIELDGVVAHAVQLMPSPIVESRVKLDLQPVRCWADPVRVRQAIRALIGHCLTYLDGHVVLHTRRDRRTAVVVARYDAPMRHDDIREGLDPVGRLRVAGSRPHPVGMGLATAARLAELMGGKLSHRRDGSSSIFEIHLPVQGQS